MATVLRGVDYVRVPDLLTDRMCVMNETEKKAVGRIIRVSEAGWGFISSKDIKFTRIFFHWTALRQDTLTFTELHTGMYVEFTPLQIPGKGYRAMHVRVIERPTNVIEESDVPEMSELGPESIGTVE